MRITKKCEAMYGGQMTRDLYNYHRQIGGKMSISQFQKFLTNSYSKTPEQKIDDFEYDPELSIDRAKVYHDPRTGQAVITHTGTDSSSDWLNNLAIATNTYKYTPRYKNAKKAQEATEKKYGKQNVSTTGHSQGARLAEKLGKESKEILTLNKATNPFEQHSSKNQTDVRSSGDWVSSLNPLGWMEKNKKVVIPKQSNDIIKEHSPDVLSRIDPNMMIGEGRTYKQKFNKKFGFPKDKSHSLTEISKITGYDKDGLKTIVDKGKGAYFSNPESVRPNVTNPEQWSMARLYASLDPTSKSHKIDKSHLKVNKKLRNLCDCGMCPYCC